MATTVVPTTQVSSPPLATQKSLRTLPSDTQISILFNYIGVDRLQNPLTETFIDVALPPLEESFHRHHNQVLDLYVHTEHSEEQRMASQLTYDSTAQWRPTPQGLVALYPTNIPAHHGFNGMPIHYLGAVVRFGQAQLCGAQPWVFDEILRQLIDDKKFQSHKLWNRRIGFHNMEIDRRDTDSECRTRGWRGTAIPKHRICTVAQPNFTEVPKCLDRGWNCMKVYTWLMVQFCGGHDKDHMPRELELSRVEADEAFAEDWVILRMLNITKRNNLQGQGCGICHRLYAVPDIVRERADPIMPCPHQPFHLLCYKDVVFNSTDDVMGCPHGCDVGGTAYDDIPV